MKEFKHFDKITPEERIERWEQARRVLKSLSPHERRKHWNMAFWGEKTACGTVACAAGHCGLDPWFRRRGFQLNFEKSTGSDPPEFYDDISDVDAFFGRRGSERIFYNTKRRPVGKVIREMTAYITELKERAGK